LDPGQIVQTEAPAHGTRQPVNVNVTMQIGPAAATVAGYSVVELYNTNSNHQSYDIWTNDGSGWTQVGADDADNSAYAVPESGTLTDGVYTQVHAMFPGDDPNNDSPRSDWNVLGNSTGPTVSYNYD
jgi:hypothetical protein